MYVVRSEDGDRERVIHRNLLAQCMFFPVGSKHLAGEETDMEDVSGMDSIVSEEEEEVIEAIVSGDSGMITQCPSVELPYVASEECEQDEHQLKETVYGKEEDKEQTPLKVSNPDPPKRRYPERIRRPPNRLSLEIHALQSESDKEKLERGKKVWEKAKAKKNCRSNTLSHTHSPHILKRLS